CGRRTDVIEGAEVGAPGRVKPAHRGVASFHGGLKGPGGEAVAAPVSLMAMAHVHPVGDTQRIIALAVRAEDAGIDIINPAAEMLVEIFVEVVVPLNGPGIEDGEIVRLLAVF